MANFLQNLGKISKQVTEYQYESGTDLIYDQTIQIQINGGFEYTGETITYTPCIPTTLQGEFCAATSIKNELLGIDWPLFSTCMEMACPSQKDFLTAELCEDCFVLTGKNWGEWGECVTKNSLGIIYDAYLPDEYNPFTDVNVDHVEWNPTTIIQVNGNVERHDETVYYTPCTITNFEGVYCLDVNTPQGTTNWYDFNTCISEECPTQ